ncbi:PAS domain-containing protein [Thiorhodovibrio frisius]|nr:PAS domain-containing protein [Thiorhodovibrio frisius]
MSSDILGFSTADIHRDPFLWHNAIHPDDRPASRPPSTPLPTVTP